MFTGIIQAVGEVAALEQSGGDLKLRIKTGKLPLADVQLGDSIATNGVCLTVTELRGTATGLMCLMKRSRLHRSSKFQSVVR